MLNTLTRKEREKLLKKKEIASAAAKIFAEKGYSAATLEDIASSAEFGKGTLYNYFSGKEEIYKAVLDGVMDYYIELSAEAEAKTGSLREFLEYYTRHFFEYSIKNKDSFLLFIREIAHLNTDYLAADRTEIFDKYKKIKQVFIGRIEKSIQSGEIKDLHPEKLSYVYDHFTFAYLHFIVACKNFEVKEDEEAAFLLSILFDGIMNKDEGKK